MANQVRDALKILRRKQLEERLQLSRTTIYERMRTDPAFPKSVNLGGRAVGWIEGEVDAYLVFLIERSRTKVA